MNLPLEKELLMSTVTELFGVVPTDGSIDPNDISNGFYPHLRKAL